MDFTHDEDLVAVRDPAREIFTDRATTDRVREVEGSVTHLDEELWAHLASAGLPGPRPSGVVRRSRARRRRALRRPGGAGSDRRTGALVVGGCRLARGRLLRHPCPARRAARRCRRRVAADHARPRGVRRRGPRDAAMCRHPIRGWLAPHRDEGRRALAFRCLARAGVRHRRRWSGAVPGPDRRRRDRPGADRDHEPRPGRPPHPDRRCRRAGR
ncbi:hypothetical protein LP418_26925 [Nocardioides sp. B-3]|nr:hypothetical protein [Nocardioides sp. B-3]UUZ59396.1 hypothetical protein LP418_26925 [Nocardioides sp. B-3]